jgi:cell division protein FtsB
MMDDDFASDDLPGQRLERWLRRLIRAGKFCLLLLVVPAIVQFHQHPMAEQQAMRTKLEALQRERDTLLVERDKLLRQVDWIKNDIGYLEVRARDHENMHKKGEYVIRFED